MGEQKRKLKRALSLTWSIPLLVILFVVGIVLSVIVEKRQLRREA